MSQDTIESIYASLRQQGYSQDDALRLARAAEPQDSNLVPNLAEGLAFTGAGALASRFKPTSGYGKFAKYVSPVLAANIANYAGTELSGTNYYDKASVPQLLADMGGSMLGASLGERAGKSLLRRGTEAAAKKSAESLAGRAIGSTAGRYIGAGLGAAAGPLGSILGATALGWLAPKLFKNADEEGSNLIPAALTSAAVAASPYGRAFGRIAIDGKDALKTAFPKVAAFGSEKYAPFRRWSERHLPDLATPLGDAATNISNSIKAPLRNAFDGAPMQAFKAARYDSMGKYTYPYAYATDSSLDRNLTRATNETESNIAGATAYIRNLAKHLMENQDVAN